MNRTFSLGFGNNRISATLSEGEIINVLEGAPVAAVTDVAAAVKQALAEPIGAPPLAEVVRPGDRVVIAVSDVTRRWIRHDLFLPVLLDELNAAGVPDRDILLLVAMGAHRPHTAAENVQCYGQAVLDRVELRQSYAPNSEDFVYVGTTTRGTVSYLNRYAVDADKVILTGGIVHHLMAGFGGGRKSVLPGLSGYSSIQANHSFCLHPEVGRGVNPECDAGKLDGNPMNEDAMEIAAMLRPAFILNAVLTPEGGFARFVAGAWDQAWLAGCKAVDGIFGMPIREKTDLVLATAGGFPQDINLYQGAKTIYNASRAAKPGGVVITLLECRDIAEPPEFSSWFDHASLYDHELHLRQGFTVPGFIALRLGYLARQYTLIVVTLPENHEFIKKTGMIPAASLEEALRIAAGKLPAAYTVTVMPQGANTVPML